MAEATALITKVFPSVMRDYVRERKWLTVLDDGMGAQINRCLRLQPLRAGFCLSDVRLQAKTRIVNEMKI